MKSARWLPLAALALLGPLSVPAHAQWVPGGTVIASNVYEPNVVLAVPDGQAGVLVFAPELGSNDFGHEVARVGPNGLFPPGWPSTAIQASLKSAGLAADGTGGAYVGRFRQGPTGSQIVVRHLLADGSLDPAWPDTGRVVADLPGLQGIQLAADGAGGVYAAFSVDTGQGSQLSVLRLDVTGATSPGWPAEGVHIAQSGEFIHFGDVQASTSGVYLTAYLTLSFSDYEGHDAFVGHVSPSGGIPTGWGTGTVVLPWAVNQPPSSYAPDPAGGIYYTWSTGLVRRLVHLLADASLDPGWPVRGLALLSDTTHYQILYRPVSDGAGGCFARFDYDSAGTDTSLVPRLVHITANATPEPGWPLLGGRLPYVSKNYPSPDIVPDGNGGAYATWFDEPTPYGFRYFRAHHLAAGGATAPYWPPSGLTLASGAGARLASRTVTDSHGGAIAVWEDVRSDTAIPFDSTNVLALGFGPDGSLTTSVGSRGVGMAGGLRASPVPSRGATHLAFSLAQVSTVRVEVLDLNGRRVRRVFEGSLAPGPHSVVWDGLDDAGRPLPPGVYLGHANGAGVAAATRLVRIR
jgi:hypothetical protein